VGELSTFVPFSLWITWRLVMVESAQVWFFYSAKYCSNLIEKMQKCDFKSISVGEFPVGNVK
ncbi:hypothetical protein QN363_20200, partial [Undibacterium sp. CCC2.1]|uniref:hypothetical protein n=1 Tax=Undibacterium sp. CCC2.1 TaxID=3048604 RepID=UPI002B2290BE